MSISTVLNDAVAATAGETGGPGPSPAARPVSGPGNPYAMLRRGIHPATRLPLLVGSRADATCGGCAQRFERPTSRGARDKCAASPDRMRGGPDVPADYPACQAYTPTAPDPVRAERAVLCAPLAPAETGCTA